jgi:chromosome segregation ATPase
MRNNKNTFSIKKISPTTLTGAVGQIIIQFLLFAFAFPTVGPAHPTGVTLGQSSIYYSQNQWHFLLILQVVVVLASSALIATLGIVLHHLHTLQEKPSTAAATAPRIAAPRLPTSPPAQSTGEDQQQLARQLKTHLVRLQNTSKQLRETSLPLPGKSLLLPSSTSQILQLQQMVSSCLFASKNDYHHLCQIKDELRAFKGLFVEIQRSLGEELSLLRDAAKSQLQLTRDIKHQDGHLALCRNISTEMLEKLGSCSEHLTRSSHWMESSLSSVDSSSFSTSVVNIHPSNIAHLPTVPRTLPEESANSADTLQEAREKLRFLIDKLRLVAQAGDELRKESSKGAHALAYCETYHSLYRTKMRYLEDAIMGYGQRLEGIGDQLQRRIGELTNISEGLVRSERESRAIQDVYQECLGINENYRRSLDAQRVASTHSERALRNMAQIVS